MRKYIRHRRNGAAIAELAAAFALLIPLVALTAWAVVEASQAYMIHGALHQCALTAARKLAIAYGYDRAAAMSNPNATFSTVRFGGIVNDNSQFTIPDGTAGWNTTAEPPTVTVVCQFHPGQHGLQELPNPDPLHLGNTFVLQAQATCRLE
ncbi:MAG TPA: hypothetical protein V6D17_06650 [Candidatus Obscuribacterales bacterium]